MRARVGSDWVTDLAGRRDLESQFGRGLRDHPRLRLVADATDRYDTPDYLIDVPDIGNASVELKAKWQPYRSGWTIHRPDVPEPELFILDELALRKIVAAGRHSYLVVYDNPTKRWRIFGTTELVLAPKARVARPLRGRRPTTKGKVLVDLRDGHHGGHTLAEAVGALATMIPVTDRRWAQVEPWPVPIQEDAG